jgi:hypothetical protein
MKCRQWNAGGKEETMTLNNDLVCALDEGRQKMRDLLVELDGDYEVYPGWTAKNLVAHITGWDDAVLASLHSYLTGDIPATPAASGFDLYNAGTVEKRSGLPFDAVTREWEQTRMALKDLVNSLPENQLNETILTPWGTHSTIYSMVMEMALHEKDHVLEIQGNKE